MKSEARRLNNRFAEEGVKYRLFLNSTNRRMNMNTALLNGIFAVHTMNL